jgi:hypothetical protein
MSQTATSNQSSRESSGLGWWLAALPPILLLYGIGLLDLPIQFIGLMLFGWAQYLAQVVPRVTFNPEIAFDAVAALALGLLGLHGLLRWWTKHQRGNAVVWRFGWTLKIAVMVLTLFVLSVVVVGLVQQIAWLTQEPTIVVDNMKVRGAMTIELSNLKQTAIALKAYAADHDGQLPAQLSDLFPEYVLENRIFFSKASAENPAQLILYYPGHSTRDAAETIIVASPQPWGSSEAERCVARLDTWVRVIPEEQFQETIQRQESARNAALK